MSLWMLLALAAVQGATEFIPISSSAHLVFLQSLFHLQNDMLFVDVFLHLSTLAAVFLVFRRELHEIFRAIFRRDPSRSFRERLATESGLRTAYLVCVATIPTGIIGLAFHDYFKAAYSDPASTGLQLVANGILLWISGFWKDSGKKMAITTTTRDALVIGVVQGLSILPGISRSGSTIFAGLFLGLHGTWAAHFSFLLSIPAILGAVIVEGKDVELAGFNPLHMSLAFATALIVGILSILVVIRTVEKGRFRLFSYYSIPVGLAAWIYFTYFA